MPQQKIIRNDATLDRPEFRVTTQEVVEIAKSIEQPFTTGDIAKRIVDSGKYRGVSYSRIERAVRASLSWMVKRETAYVDGHIIYTTPAGAISKPFLYALYPGRTWNDEIKRTETPCACADLLNQLFVFR